MGILLPILGAWNNGRWIIFQIPPYSPPYFHLWAFCTGLYFLPLQKKQFGTGVSQKESWSLNWRDTCSGIFSFKRWHLKLFPTLFSLRPTAGLPTVGRQAAKILRFLLASFLLCETIFFSQRRQDAKGFCIVHPFQ